MGPITVHESTGDDLLPEWMQTLEAPALEASPLEVPPPEAPTLEALVLQKTPGSSARWKGLGVAVSIVIAVVAIFVLAHALRHVDYQEVFAAIRSTKTGVVVLAFALVVSSYGSLTLYDLLALRTIGLIDIPYRIAALASFVSYPIAHGTGAVAVVSPIIRYRIYSLRGLGVVDVAKICFLTGLTFWLGNLTALGLSLLYEPSAISLIDYIMPAVNRMLAAAILLGIVAFLVWSWRAPRSIGTQRWSVRIPSGPVVLLQIAIGIFDLGAAALAMYVLIPPDLHIEFSRVVVVFIAATLLGFASHAPAGLGVFDATIVLGLAGEDKEPILAALLIFRFLYHFLPFLAASCLFGIVEATRGFRAKASL
jgi:hypothetical protein